METEYFFQKLDNNTNKKQIEVYFNEAGFTPLYKSNLKENSFYLFNEDFSVGDISKVNLKVDIEENRKIRIWTSHSNIHEYLSFLYICHKCPNNDISVIFTDDYEKNLYSLGAANYKEITKILKYEIHLIKKDIEKYNNEWLELVKINSELRLFKNKKIISVNYDYLNEYILKYYNKKEDIRKIIAKLKGHDEENNLEYNVYEFLINRLITNKTNK